MEKYFDAFLHVTNWGSRRLMFRLPRSAVDVKLLASYCLDESTSVKTKGQHVILDFWSENECDEWLEGKDCLTPLTPLRNDILHGDLRAPYVAWLVGVQDGRLAAGDEPRPHLALKQANGGQVIRPVGGSVS
jgi:hypothetical protein